MANWTIEPQPFGANHTPLLTALSSIDGVTPVPIAADPTTGGLVVSATISSAGIATSANQTDGSQKTQIVDGSGNVVTVTGNKLDVNATASLAGSSIPISGASTGVGVAILDSSGNQISSFGGGTQYAEGTDISTGVSPIGTVTMTRNDNDDTAYPIKSHVGAIFVEQINQAVNVITSDFLDTKLLSTSNPGVRADVNINNQLLVDGSGVTQPVSGTITVNAGTDLNTSALALESGGNLATIAGKDFATQTTLAALNTKVTAVNTGAVVVSSSALPAGAATAAKQPALGTAGTSSADVITVQGRASMTPLLTDASATTQPISAASLPLPSGASTATKQDTGNTSVASIDTKTPALGQALAAASVPIVLTAAQITTLTPPAAITGFSTSTKQSDGSQKSQIVDGSGNVIGATSNALDINIKSGNPTTIAATQSGTWNITNVSGTVSLPTGAATSANQSTEITSLATIAALSKVEDAPHSSGDTGVPIWAVRNDTGAVFAGSDGDYIPFATDATGALRVDLNGTVSTNNSTTSVLAGGAVFTGTSEDVLNYNEIRISVIASHASATDGLSIQQSSDNTNWDITDTYTIAAATGKTFVVPRQTRYMRIVYTNGATLQTSFRLQTILNRLGTVASSQRSSDAYTNETDLQEVWSFNSVWNSAAWDRVRSIINATNSVGTGIIAAGMVAQFDDVSPTAITENQFGNARMSANRNLYNTIRDAAGNERGANVSAGNALLVDASATTQPVSYATTGSGTATGALRVEVANNGTGVVGLNTGTNSIGKISDITTSVVPGTGATNLGKAEDAAHTTGDTGVFTLGVRNDTLADVTNTTADYSQYSTDIKGRLMTAGAPRSLKGNAQTQLSNTTTETTIIAATASTFHDVYGIILANTGASTTKVSIRDDTAGTVRAIIEVPTLETRGFMLPVDSAMNQTAVNKNWTAQCGTATTALEVTALYVSMV